MHWRHLFIVAALFPAGCAREERGDEPTTVPRGDLAESPPPPRGWTQRASYQGTVTAISGTSIILAPGQVAPRAFPIKESLAKETAPPAILRGACYLPSDVRVGDRVEIRYADDGQVAVCEEITILRRPGGLVPPDHAAIAPPFTRHHELMQAWQDWEERGVPIPAKYITRGRADHLNPPYPPRAPMPREVPAKP